MEIILLKAVSCRWCGRSFYICLSCWRGQAYCRDSCRHHFPSEKPTVWPNKGIAGPQKAGKPTGKRKEDEGCKFLKKPWLMHLQYLHPDVIDYLMSSRLSFLVAIFVVKKVWL